MTRTRLLPVVAVLCAGIAGSSCLNADITNSNKGLPPDTLPLVIADSVITFSVSTSALYTGDTLGTFFSVKNNGSAPLELRGSSGCTFTVRIYAANGSLVSPVNRACTDDLHSWATIAPGASFTKAVTWVSSTSGTLGGSQIPAGVYDVEPYLDAMQFQRTGRRLKIQIVNR